MIAPRMIGVARMKRIPPRRLSSRGGSAADPPAPRDASRGAAAATRRRAARRRRVDRFGLDREEQAADRRAARSSPTWPAIERSAIAPVSSSAGTSSGIERAPGGVAEAADGRRSATASATNGHSWSRAVDRDDEEQRRRSPRRRSPRRSRRVRRGSRSASCPAGRASSSTGSELGEPDQTRGRRRCGGSSTPASRSRRRPSASRRSSRASRSRAAGSRGAASAGGSAGHLAHSAFFGSS